MASIFDRVRRVVVEQLGVEVEDVTPTANFVADLGADSLDLVELRMALEEEFSTPARAIEIPEEDAEELVTVQDVVNYLSDLGIGDD